MATKIGMSQITKPTPLWASWMFRIVFILTTVAVFIIAGDPGISDALKVRIGVYLKGLDMFIYAVSKLFGIDVKSTTETITTSTTETTETTGQTGVQS